MTERQPTPPLDRPLLCVNRDSGRESRVRGGGMLVLAAGNSWVQRGGHVRASVTVEGLPLAMTVIQRQLTVPISAAPIDTCRWVALSDARGRSKAGARP
jgi:hypothetical protein